MWPALDFIVTKQSLCSQIVSVEEARRRSTVGALELANDDSSLIPDLLSESNLLNEPHLITVSRFFTFCSVGSWSGWCLCVSGIGVGAGKLLGVRRIFARIVPNLPQNSRAPFLFILSEVLPGFSPNQNIWGRALSPGSYTSGIKSSVVSWWESENRWVKNPFKKKQKRQWDQNERENQLIIGFENPSEKHARNMKCLVYFSYFTLNTSWACSKMLLL